MGPTRVIDRETWCECVELLEAEKRRRGTRQTALLLVLTIAITAGLVAGGFVVGFSLDALTNPPSVRAAGTLNNTDQDLSRIYAELDRAVVKVRAVRQGRINLDRPLERRGESGSGFFVSAEGHIITNYHVVDGAADVTVLLSTGDHIRAEVIGRDAATDLALLKIEPPASGVTVARFGDSAGVRVGQLALALGSPFGLERTLTVGHISALGRTIKSEDKYIARIHDVIQTDAAINPGNSGGPLLNASGEVIGVNTAIFSTSRGSQGVGFAIPSNTVKAVMSSLLRRGYVSRPYLGIVGIPLDELMASRLGLSVNRGLLIQTVRSGSGAAKAGLRGGDQTVIAGGRRILAGGDVLLEIEGIELGDSDDVVRIVGEREIGTFVRVALWRDGERLEVAVPLYEAPH